MGHRSRAEWWWVMMWCAVLVALAVLIWPGNKSGRLYRLAYRGRAVDSAAINEPRYAGSPRVGVAQVITSAIALRATAISRFTAITMTTVTA